MNRPLSMSSAALLSLVLVGPSMAQVLPQPTEWEAAAAQLVGLCQDRVAGRPVAEGDVQRLSQQEAQLRATLLAAGDRRLVHAAVEDARSRFEVTRERYFSWGKAQLGAFSDLVRTGSELLSRKPGRATRAQQETALNALEHFEAALGRIQGASARQEITGAGIDEFLGVLSTLLLAAQPVVEAGGDLRPALVQAGLALHREVATAAQVEKSVRERQSLLEQGQTEAALNGLLDLLGAQTIWARELVQVRDERTNLRERFAQHDRELQQCQAQPTGTTAQPQPALTPPPVAPPASTPAVAPVTPPGQVPAATAPLAEQLTYWADHATDDPGPPGPGGELGALNLEGWLLDPAAGARTATGAPLQSRSGGARLPVNLWPSLAAQIEPPVPAPDATRSHFGELGQGDTAALREALRTALAAGRKNDALTAYMQITREPKETALPAVEDLLAGQAALKKIGSVEQAGRPPLALPAQLPPPPAVDLAAQLVAARRAASTRRAPDRRFSQPGPLDAPAMVNDGSRGTEEALDQASRAQQEEAQRKVEAETGRRVADHERQQAEIEAANRQAAAAHPDLIRTRVYGPLPGNCPAGQEPCACPELHVPEAHDGRCHPPGTPCVGAPPVRLDFEP